MKEIISILIDTENYKFNWIEGEPDHIEEEDGLFLRYSNQAAESEFNLDKVLIDCNYSAKKNASNVIFYLTRVFVKNLFFHSSFKTLDI